MAIKEKDKHLHWNYFLAVENDVEKLSRYIEFTKDNFKVYSLEMTHLLLAASSEVDVVAKLICEREASNHSAANI